MLAAGAAQAQQQPAQPEDDEEETVYVYGRAIELGEKYTAPLLDLPQSITVIPREVIDQQNLLTMRDILSTLPGITFGAGEGGGGYGDSINLRGYSANNDLTVDGVRDSAQYSRTDPFNLEQIQLVSGANSVYAGAGAVGGSINIVTKTPRGADDVAITAAVGTDAYGRVTFDGEKVLADGFSARLNLMAHQNDVPGRDVETFERWGFAPSFAFDLGPQTQYSVAYVRQEDDNIPQYGVPYALGPYNDGQLPGAPLSAYYGYANADKQETTLDSLTGILEHDFSSNLGLRNVTRWQAVDQLAIVNPPQGSWCVEPGINPWTGAACATPGVYDPSGPRGTTRDTANEILANQTDLTATFATGAIAHTLVAGVSVSQESYGRLSGNSQRNPDGSSVAYPPMDISNPDNVYTGPINFIPNQRADSEVNNQAVYVFDRLQITERLELNGGVRFEHNEGSFDQWAISNPPNPVETPSPTAESEDDLLSYRLGLVFKPTSNSGLYIAHGNSSTPSQSTVNGGCNVTTNCNVDPEEAQNTEIGGKWDAMGGDLSLTAAIFRNERTNFRVNSGDPLVPEQQLDGESRVDGVALGVTGALTDRWTVFANYTFLDSEILQNISDVDVGGGVIDIQAGAPLPVTPEHSGSLWSTYQLTDDLLLGYGATYTGEMSFSRQAAGSPLFFTEGYWVHRAMAAYEINDNLAVQLNVSNLTDEEYFQRIRNNTTNGWATPGDARSAVLSLTYRR